MIKVESKRKKEETLRNQYPDALIIDVTSNSDSQFVKFSPFYPHGGIPVPFSEEYKAQSVEGIWQGLKVFETEGIDLDTMRNATMKNLKRTVRTHGKCLGHQKGLSSTELLGYGDARHQIYLPAYKWVLENKIPGLVKYLRSQSAERTVVLLDYETNSDVDDLSKPLSHASLIKAMVEGNYPE